MIDIHGDLFRRGLQQQGLNEGFLQEICRGRIQSGATSLLLVRKEGPAITVTWSAILTSDGLPAGRLIRFAIEDEAAVNADLLETVMNVRRRLQVLSPRELQILKLLAHGNTNKAIARLTDISEKTVEKHRTRMMQKLKVSKSAELVRLITIASMIEPQKEMAEPSVG